MHTLFAHANAFWRLVQARVLSGSFPSTAKVRLSGNCYVGRAQLGGISIDLEEKVEGALLALIDAATSQSFRVHNVASPRSSFGPSVVIIIAHFIALLKAYASRGREFVYSKRLEQGSLVGGKLNITRTLQLRARGLLSQIAFERTTIDRSTAKNRVLLAAVTEIGRLAKVAKVDHDLLSSARGLAMIFEDCRSDAALSATRTELARQAQALAEAPGESDRDLLLFAAVILEHASFDVTSPIAGTVPRSWFLNLETLFEAKIRWTLHSMLSECGFSKGTIHNQRRFVFPSTALHVADPDLVIDSTDILLVGDVKYKNWQYDADASDLYQLLTHAEAFGACKAFLIFPHETFVSRKLGTTSNGIETWLFGVDVGRLNVDLGSCLQEMGVSNVSKEKTPLPPEQIRADGASSIVKHDS